jgi:diguanylate cyclase (GGDEF)-like protein
MHSAGEPQTTPSDARNTPAGLSSRPARILVVEDERIVALDLSSTLEDLGYRVVGVAATGAEAHQLANQERPDLVLMDVRLQGDVDGIQTAASLRTEWHLPIVFLTANANGETLRRALETCPGGFLAKPYDEQSLLSGIEVALRRHDIETRLRDANSALQHASSFDELTGFYRRRCLDGALAREMEFAERDQHSVGVILLCPDQLQSVAEKFGQRARDVVLRQTAARLRGRLRAYDIACRYDSDALLVVVPGTSLHGAARVAEDLRHCVALASFDDGRGSLGQVTASFGVASFPEQADSVADLLQVVEAELARAQASGQNRVAVRGE